MGIESTKGLNHNPVKRDNNTLRKVENPSAGNKVALIKETLSKTSGDLKKKFTENFSQKDIKTLDDVVRVTGLKKEFLQSVIDEETIIKKEKNDLIGIGHKISTDPNYKFGKTVTDAQVYYLFAKDLVREEGNIYKLNNDLHKKQGIELTEGQINTLTDVSFNVGYTKFSKGKTIKKLQLAAYAKKQSEAKTLIDDAVKDLDYIRQGKEVQPAICRRRIKGIYDYAKDNPTQTALETMTKLKNKADSVYNVRLVKNKKDTASLNAQKNDFKVATAHLIHKIKKGVDDKKSKNIFKPKTEVTFWQKVKSFFSNLFA